MQAGRKMRPSQSPGFLLFRCDPAGLLIFVFITKRSIDVSEPRTNTIGWILFAVICLLPFQLQAQQKSFVVRGTLTGADGKTISLVSVDGNKKESAYIIRNEQFLLSGKTDSLAVCALVMEDAAPLLIVGRPDDTIDVHTTLNQFPLATVKGNDQSLAMQQYQKEFFPMMEKAKAINEEATQTPEHDSAAQASLQQKADAFNQQMKTTGLAFIQYHPKAVASIFVLMNEMHVIPPPQLQNLFRSLSPEVQNSRYGKMASMQINMMAATAIGANAPAFTLKDAQGKPVSLSSFKGKYVLIDFWASWCGPCRAENPNVVRAFQQYKDKNFTVLGVSLDKSKTSWLNAIRQDGLEWTQVSDLAGWNNEAAQLYHVYSIPTNFLIDPSGKIIAKNLRGPALENALAEIFP